MIKTNDDFVKYRKTNNLTTSDKGMQSLEPVTNPIEDDCTERNSHCNSEKPILPWDFKPGKLDLMGKEPERYRWDLLGLGNTSTW